MNLERGLVGGILLMAAGFGVLVAALLSWRAVDYGAISYPDSLRKVIPAVTLITVGFEVCFSSFFLSVLNVAKGAQNR